MSTVHEDPRGMRSVTPHLICKNAVQAIAFYVEAFGAREGMKLLAPNGQLIHAGLHIGDSMIMLAEECGDNPGPLTRPGSPVVIHLTVDDVDATMSRAAASGATVTMPPTDMFWGDRYGQLTDPFGHRWAVAKHIRDVSFEEMERAAREMCAPKA